VFPSTKMNGKVYFDGGVIYSADFSTAIQRCRELVDNDSKITVDIIVTHPHKKSKYS